MPRIVAGAAKGRRLAVPPAGTRPTSDRAREGLFNALATMLDLDGARVLDLYAGSGAVGLEALSRGAASAVFVEDDGRAAQVLVENLAAVGLPGGTVVRARVHEHLTRAVARETQQTEAPVDGAPAGPGFGPADLVFADPPYAVGDAEIAEVLRLLCSPAVTRAGTVVVLERATRSAPPVWPAGRTGLEPVRDRRYGETTLWYGRRP